MKWFSICVLALSLTAVSVRADAQARRGAPRGGSPAGHAVPRATPPGPAPGGGVGRVAPSAVAPYRPYYYPYGSSLGFYAGYPFGFYGYYGYPYPYSYYGYRYGYGYGYGYPGGYLAVGPGATYGSVRIQGAPRDAQVYADGYYVGVVDDFDGTFQHLNLTPGAHHIEVRPKNAPVMAFDVQVQPGQNITYHAD